FQMWPSLIAICWWPYLTRQGVVAGLVVGLVAVTLTESIGAQFMPWGRWPMTLHSAFWGILFNLIVAILVSAMTQNDEEMQHRMVFHRFLREHAGLPKEKRGLVPVAWIITLTWFFFGIGPGAVIGNWIFGDPTDASSWLFGIPSIWAWQILWWALGVFMMWFLAYRMELSRVPHKEVEALHEDIGDIDFGSDQSR
ncbi:MAG: sodium:solute symporter family protein, partial [Gammaproteobacteria bacterium]|nr:sodium:solute symporter family protein [Gammaproteobacteria bacterium]